MKAIHSRVVICIVLLVATYATAPLGQAAEKGFFRIHNVAVHTVSPPDGFGLFSIKVRDGKTNFDFEPSVEVAVEAKENLEAREASLKIYVLNADNKIQSTLQKPGLAKRGFEHYALPPVFAKGTVERIFFPLPKLKAGEKVRYLAVFGDSKEVAARLNTGEPLGGIDFPEKKVANPLVPPAATRKQPIDRVFEVVTKPQSKLQPQLTLLMRLPTGVEKGADVAGVMAMCVVGHQVADIRRTLQGLDHGNDSWGVIQYAESHNLAMLAWGSSNVWNAGVDMADLPADKRRMYDAEFDAVSRAWESGVEHFHKTLGTPKRNFFMYGTCMSGNWVHRLALRKPQYFLAVHSHLAASFDEPTPEGRNVLWLVSTGELFGGYNGALRFYDKARKLGYPIMFKAYPNVGHSHFGIAWELGSTFFDYARTQQAQRAIMESTTELNKGERQYDAMANPPYYGDALNQEMFPAAKVELIPSAFRVPLPTEDVALDWNKYGVGWDDKTLTRATGN